MKKITFVLFSLLSAFALYGEAVKIPVPAPLPTQKTLKIAEQPERAVPMELAIEQTLSIIKPDAIENNQVGELIEYLENAGLHIVASKMVKLTPEQAKMFYAAHKDKAFFSDLIAFMSSGPVIIQVLEGEDAVAVNRQIMGATDPALASPGTIRSDFGTDIQRNAIHGSDNLENAKKEISHFFKPQEIYSHY